MPPQIAMALTSCASSLALAYKGAANKTVYLAAGLGMLSLLPYTVICIFPINHQLQSAEKKEDREVYSLQRMRSK